MHAVVVTEEERTAHTLDRDVAASAWQSRTQATFRMVLVADGDVVGDPREIP
jgi:hypothetical protein